MDLHLHRMGDRALRALRATPVEAALAIGVATSASLGIGDHLAGPVALRLALTLALAFAGALAASSAHALGLLRARSRWALTAALLAAAALHGALLLDPAHRTELWRWAFLLAAAAAATLLVPAAAPAPGVTPSDRFWRFALRLAGRAAAALAYGGLLWVGLAVALAALQSLFQVRVPGAAWLHLAAWTFLALVPLLALGGLPEAARLEEPVAPRTLRLLGTAGTFLFLPLVVLYLGLLLAYLVRVAVTREVPSNVLSPLTLGAGALGWLGHFALHPTLAAEGRRPLRWALRNFPLAFLLLGPVGVGSIVARIDQYGWTEFRYARAAALVALTLLSLLATAPALRRRASPLVAGPALLLVLALLAAAGPLSAAQVSRRSQLARARAAASAQGFLGADGRLLPRPQLERALQERGYADTRALDAALTYLLDAHGPGAVAPLSAAPLAGLASTHDRLVALGLRPAGWWEGGGHGWVRLDRPEDRAFTLPRGGRAQAFRLWTQRVSVVHGLSLSVQGTDLLALGPQVEWRASLAPLGADGRPLGPQAYRTRALREDEVVRPLRDAAGAVVGAVVLESLTFEADGAGWHASAAQGLLVLH